MFRTVAELEQKLSEPSPALVEGLKALEGDILILGVSGKMGPTLAQMAVRAANLAGKGQKVYGAARFSNPEERNKLQAAGVETIALDLLHDDLSVLHPAPNVIYMVGHKFGTTGREHVAWAVNTYTAGRVAEALKGRRVVVFSTGNVYPLTPVTMGGATETHPPGPVGEYAQSCLGRERLFQWAAAEFDTQVLIYRLNYAIDLRYGVLCDIAQAVYAGKSVDLNMGHVNVIWQGDANERALRSLLHAAKPAKILNVTGPEILSVRWIAEEFGRRFGKEVLFTGEEQPTALLRNAQESMRLFGYPRVSVHEMLDWTAEWIRQGMPLLNKPTHFSERKGAF